MDRLILMRHGTAARRGPSGGDFDRPLTPEGRIEAADTAAALAAAGLVPDVAVVSSAARAAQTWEAASKAFAQARAVMERAVYSIHPQGVLDLAEIHDAPCVMVVGHNPTLHELTLGLLRQGGAPAGLIARVEMNFPPATAVAFSFDAEGAPRLDGLFYAAEVGA